jgi:hypothetical protein
VILKPGQTYYDAADALRKSGHQTAYVVHISARSLELLCEDLGSPSANTEFNDIMHTVLGVAEQVRYCDQAENPTYGRGPAAYDEWNNPINCTWGFVRPPLLPAQRAECRTDIDEIIKDRWRSLAAERKWDNPSWGGLQSKRRQAWSTRDRPAYLHKN